MKILVSDKIDEAALDLLQDRGFEIELLIRPDNATLINSVKDVDGWIIRSGTDATAELINQASNLKVIGRAGVGVDNIDLDEATKAGIAVLNTPRGNTLAAVEHSMAMLFSLARNIPQAHHSLISSGSWERSQFTGVELHGKTIGIVGLGKVGSRVAMRCNCMEMNVIGYDPFISDDQAKTMNIELFSDLDALLAQCDFVTLHLPATDDTVKLISEERLGFCKTGVRIINCARGSLIDELALARALIKKQVAGAALDVFENEPPLDSPLLKAPNLIITPHLGASTIESQRNVGIQIAEQVADALQNGIFKEAVNIPVDNWQTFSRLKPKLELAEKLGNLAQQYAGKAIKHVHVEYCGEGFEETAAINNTMLKGILLSANKSSVNAVNAALIAEERGLTISSEEGKPSPHYRSLLRITVKTDKAEHIFAGTSFSDGEPRLVEIDDFEVDVLLFGVLLAFENLDEPGVIGNVGSILGENKINIAHFSLGRFKDGGNKSGNKALGIIAVDNRITRKVLKLLSDLPNMQWVNQILLKVRN